MMRKLLFLPLLLTGCMSAYIPIKPGDTLRMKAHYTRLIVVDTGKINHGFDGQKTWVITNWAIKQNMSTKPTKP